MRFTVAWANVVSENLALKLALGCLALVLVAQSLVAFKLASRKPLVIERACYSRAIPSVDGGRTPAEVEIFVREALPMRFDTSARVTPSFISEEEGKFRVQEQQEFKNRNLSQRILVNRINLSGDQVAVDADRLFTVGAVRSALPFPLVLTLGSVARSEWNPYGLSILKISAPSTGQVPGSVGK
jgi:hypothetical protein